MAALHCSCPAGTAHQCTTLATEHPITSISSDNHHKKTLSTAQDFHRHTKAASNTTMVKEPQAFQMSAWCSGGSSGHNFSLTNPSKNITAA